jgi:hypothetical protein
MLVRLLEGDEDGDGGDELEGEEEGVVVAVERLALAWERLEDPPRAVSRAALSA